MTSASSSVAEVDENAEFKDLMERAGVKHRVRLASGSRGRGLFSTGPVGWKQSDVLLSVPLDVCIAAPFGDADVVKTEFRSGPGFKDTLVILRRAWERKNACKIPKAITNLLDSGVGDDRELAVVLWLLWATKHGGEVWKAYAEWLPQISEMPNLMLASERELSQLQDDALADEARNLQRLIAAAHERLPEINKAATDMKGAPMTDVSLAELRWGYALVASRAVASEVGDSGEYAAILVPFFDMANHDDVRDVTAVKSIRGTEDGDVEGGLRVMAERALNQGVGGPRMVLETTRAMKSDQDEVVISYDPTGSNRELMLRYGFSLRCNRNDKIERPAAPDRASSALVAPEPFRAALEAKDVMKEGMSDEDRARLICVFNNVTGTSAAVAEDDDGAWELDEDDVKTETAAAKTLIRAWSDALNQFETSIGQDDAFLNAARAGSLPGVTSIIAAAIEYRLERKKTLRAAVGALEAYVEWLAEEDEEEEEEEEDAGGFQDVESEFPVAP